MRVLRGHPGQWSPMPGRAAVTIGVLDGVHLGHRSLIRRLDPSLVRTVLTFEPHPVEVLRPGTHPRLLTTLDERLGLFEAAGVDQVGVLNLVDIKEFDPARFVDEVLVGRLSVGQVVCGLDFRFGKDRSGDAWMLEELGNERGFIVDRAPLIEDQSGNTVSSSQIRSMIEEGRPDEASWALGSLFQITGVVCRGDRRGTKLGVPTANLEFPERKVVPGFGVYAGKVRVGESRHLAAINIGVRPTFGSGALLVEAHLLNFDADIYGEEIAVELAHYLRPELRFDNVDDLIDQMHADIEDTRDLLS